MSMSHAQKGWLLLGGGILVYEITAPKGQLLSHGVDRALQHPSPMVRYGTRAGIAVTALHLLNALDHPAVAWADPFKWSGRAFTRQYTSR